MTSMLLSQPQRLASLPPALREWLRRGSAAGLAVGLHAAAFALLLAGWQAAQAPVAQQPRTLAMQLVQLPPPTVAPPPAPVPAFDPPAPEIPQTSEVPPPVVDRAALARQRVEQERQQAQQRREQQQHLEQKRLEQERLLQQQAQAAEQARLEQQQALQREQQAAAAAAAERERQTQALASRQYLPISKEAPDYPDRALERGIEGDCTVRYRVNASGRVEEPQVVGDCHPLFVRPSLSAARTFRYQPRLIDGRAVPVEDVRNTFHYRIE